MPSVSPSMLAIGLFAAGGVVAAGNELPGVMHGTEGWMPWVVAAVLFAAGAFAMFRDNAIKILREERDLMKEKCGRIESEAIAKDLKIAELSSRPDVKQIMDIITVMSANDQNHQKMLVELLATNKVQLEQTAAHLGQTSAIHIILKEIRDYHREQVDAAKAAAAARRIGA